MSRPVVGALLVALLLAGCFAADEDGQVEDEADLVPTTVLAGGTIWTGQADPFVTAIALHDGKVLATGSENEVRAAAGENAQIIDLGGRMVIPGFHDTHNHIMDLVLGGGISLLFGDDPSATAPTTWNPVTGTAQSQATAGLHVCHWGVQHAESRGEPILGDLPPGQQMLLRQNLAREFCYLGVAPANDDATRRATLQLAQDVGFSVGLTSHMQAGLDHEDLDWFWQADEAGEVTARFAVYVWPDSIDEVAAAGWTTGHGTDHVRIVGMKIYGDGWLGPRTAALHEAFEDRPHNGFQFYEQPELDSLVLSARETGLKITAHAIGDRAVDAMLTAYEAAEASGYECVGGPTCGDPRYSIEHASLLSVGAIGRMVDLGLYPSVQLSFATSDAHWADMALGERVDRIYPWGAMVQTGLNITGSSDWPIEALPPLWGIERAVTRQEVDDSLPRAFHPEQALDVDSALRTMTVWAAQSAFRDDLGVLEPGRLADLVVLSDDLFAIDPATIADVDVIATMVGGEWVYGSV